MRKMHPIDLDRGQLLPFHFKANTSPEDMIKEWSRQNTHILMHLYSACVKWFYSFEEPFEEEKVVIMRRRLMGVNDISNQFIHLAYPWRITFIAILFLAVAIVILQQKEYKRVAPNEELHEIRIDEKSQRSCKTCDKLKDSTHWKLIEPSVLKDKGVSTYRVSPPPGSYECTVSGVRWVCACNVTMQYHFINWELFRADLDIMQYRPCGPLMDITLISGELEEIHLPHFACLGSDPSLSEAVRVLHVQDSGVFLEECEVTRFHAKLLHPSFSPKGVLVKTGFPVKAHCELLIYRTRTAHLTLHTYLVPCESTMIKAVENQEKSNGIRIIKPRPDMSLRMKSRFSLGTSCPSSIAPCITPENVKLRYSTTTPNFFEVFIENAEIDFGLKLINDNKETVWTTQIRKAEYIGPIMAYDAHFVDEHMPELISRVSDVMPIADSMLSKQHITDEVYSKIRAAKTRQEKMREVYDIVRLARPQVKDDFYTILRNKEPHLIKELAQSGP